MGTEKIRKAFYIEEELLGQVDALLPQADVRSRNEFVNRALRFYIGYLTSEKIENYMLTTISSVMHATVKDSENRMARAMYKLAVETSKLSHVIAYSHGVDEQALGKLQAKCAEEVKRINGAVRFEEAYQRKEWYMMTQMKERAVELIERIPDEKMFYVINILQNLEEMSSNRPADKKQAMEALQNVLKFSGRLPEDFDADKELQEAREEKYGNIG